MPARAGRRVAVLLAVAAVVGATALVLRPAEERVEGPTAGMVRRTEVRIAPEIGGRLASVEAPPGRHVGQGDLLAVVDNPDITAALAESRAAAASSAADRARVYSGTRPEQVSIASAAERTAQANLLLARQQYQRAATLNSHSFLSAQQLDESTASLAKAQADLDGKRAALALSQAGPTREERALSDARLALANAAVADLAAQLAKTRLIAPGPGTVGVQAAEPGEIMAPGKPVMMLKRDGAIWCAFTLREDALHGLDIGSRVALLAPDGRRIPARVSELRPLGEFATWRAARAVGDHDLNSFLLRFEPIGPAEGLEPGMTVWLDGAR